MVTLEAPTAGMVSSAHPLASQAGLDVLRAGGNAADAAVATAAALNVLDPSNTGVGGDMFALVYWAERGEVRALNGSGRAPAAATIEKYTGEGYAHMPEDGPLSVTVPGAALGWHALHAAYGTRPWTELLQPAVRFAREGFEVTPALSIQSGIGEPKLARYAHGRAIFLHDDGSAYQVGETLVQANLADTLEQLAGEGPDTFYKGALGRRFCEGLRAEGGLITPDDLAAHAVEWTMPLSTTYRDYEVLVMPPNSHGLTLLVMLNLLEPYDVAGWGPGSAERIHMQVEAKKLAFAVRRQYIGDPDHLTVDPADLCTKAYAGTLRGRLDPERTDTSPAPVPLPDERSDTTYFCVADAAGNRVSFINSLFAPFGSGVVAGDTGILCQNRGAGFSLHPDRVNALHPGRRPMHTLIPTLVMHGGEPKYTIGCIGGDQQPQGLLQILQHLIDDGDDLDAAVSARRFRSFERNQLALEGRLREHGPALERQGHALCAAEFFGACQVIETLSGGGLRAFSDPRMGGEARGA